MCLKFHSLPVTTHDTIKCELNGREGLEKFVVQVVYLDVVKKKHLSYPYLLSMHGAVRTCPHKLWCYLLFYALKDGHSFSKLVLVVDNPTEMCWHSLVFSSWIEKTMTKTIDCHWENRFVLQ